MFIAAAVLLSAAFFFLLARPLMRRAPLAQEIASNAALLKARLLEIERDRACGLLDEAAAVEAASEAKRYALLATGSAAPQIAKASRLAAIVFAGAAPLAAFLIYAAIGAPSAPPIGEPARMAEADIASMPPDERQAMIEGMVAGLSRRLEAEPADPEGWRMLARSYAVLERHEESAGAWRQLFDQSEGNEDDWRGYADVLLAIGPDGGRERELDRAMERLLALNPDQPMALYFVGVRARNDGDFARAAGLWRRLLAVLPEDAPVRAAVESLVAEADDAGQIAK